MLLQMAEYPFSHAWLIFHCIYTPHLFYPFITWWALRLLHILTIMNNTTINMRMHISLWFPVFISFGYIPRSELLDQMVHLFLIFWKTSIVFHCGCTNLPTFLSVVLKGPLFSTPSPTIDISCLDDSHSSNFEVVSPCGFHLHFPDN